MRVAWAAAAVLMGGAVTAAAEDVPRAWTIAAEPAGGRIHEDDEAPAGSLRVFRRLGRSGALRAQLGLTLSSYGALDAGVEWRTCPSCRVSPVLGAGGGVLLEGDGEFGGAFGRATAGVEAVLTPRLVLRATVQAGTHDGQAGPHLAALGLGWRF
jgi:hypothetical protein